MVFSNAFITISIHCRAFALENLASTEHLAVLFINTLLKGSYDDYQQFGYSQRLQLSPEDTVRALFFASSKLYIENILKVKLDKFSLTSSCNTTDNRSSYIFVLLKLCSNS